MEVILSMFVKGVIGFGARLVATIASEKMVEWAFFKIADGISKSTATTHDDEWVQKVRDLYFEPKTKE